MTGIYSARRRSRSIAGWLTASVLVTALGAACRQGVPVIDTTPQPAALAPGTISGIVRGPDGTSRIAGRTVEAINVDTGERVRVRTSTEGGFTLQVKPGKYRLSVALDPGEAVLQDPGVIDVNRSDLDPHRDIVIGQTRASHPTHPASAIPDGLGPPIA
jgi:hypothetical protein